jgi:tetratricopeptide (TPR) repeat protein
LALAHEALGHTTQALCDYTRALQLDRTLTDAAINRGILYYMKGRYADAATDLEQALATATGREALGVIHYNRALVNLARGDRPAALSNLEAAVNYGHEDAHNLYKRLHP